MGCLNSKGQFTHWFGNIHLSGPCNRSCYFCIGQHMMALDPLNVLDTWPLPNIDEFITQCHAKNITEINLTGSNTDPLLYKHLPELKNYLQEKIPNLIFGIRTNGVLSKQKVSELKLFDKGSITICSLNPEIYRKMMGSGSPPVLTEILPLYAHFKDLKVNIVLGPENTKGNDLTETLFYLHAYGITRVNLREPYGQPHIADPLATRGYKPTHLNLGMPVYQLFAPNKYNKQLQACYWDVHYCEVESVNLYANGIVSQTYPITKGHHQTGSVKDQSNFTHGRQQEQWIY